MRQKLFLGFLLIGIFSNAHCQIMTTYGELIFEDTIEVYPLHNWITINNPETNIWKIGKPHKTYLNAAHTGNMTILTDTVNYYSNNSNDYFYIAVPWLENIWGEGILSFYHKFDTDTLTDGGIIEVSYDDGVSWLNILNDSNHISINYIGLYLDTIRGGEFGFSGKSDNWQYVELYWHWIGVTKSTMKDLDNPLIRFRFISDENNNNKEGWMIDDIVFRGYSIGVAIDERLQRQIEVFPNPTSGILKFASNGEYFKHMKIMIYGLSGIVSNIKPLINNQVDISELNSGTYIYKIIGDGKVLSYGKLIKN